MELRNFILMNYIKNKNNVTIIRQVLQRSYTSAQPSIKSDEKPLIFCFGLSEHGALGLKKDPKKKIKPFYVAPKRHFFADEKIVTNITAGYGFSAFSVVSSDTFKVYGCGLNTDYQIGHVDSPQKVPLDIILKPVPINLGLYCSDTQIVKLSAGRAHLAVLTDKEGVFLLGSNCYGQCGREILSEDKLLGTFTVNNIKHINGEEIADVSCGQDHTLFITKSLNVWSCGWGCDGQTGLGHTQTTYTPCFVAGDIQDERIVKVTGKLDCVLALNERGEVFGWGNNEYQQITDAKDVQQVNSPRKLDILSGCGRIVDIACGGSFCMAVNEAGDLFVWGYGILGAGPELQKASKPVLLPRTLFGWSEYQPETRVTRVFCGMSHLAAINCYGHLYMWGRNRHGCLGIGHTRNQYFPYKVAFSAVAEKVSCGVDHTMVLCKPF